MRFVLASALLLAVGLAAPLAAKPPPGYDPSYAQIVSDAAQEGAVEIAATTDNAEASALLAGFQAMYPAITVSYRKWISGPLYEHFRTQAELGADTEDIVWSSAMDLQVKLVNDGYAQRYISPEAAQLPEWAVWRYEAYGTTAEPVAIVYNKSRLSEAEVPRSHADLTRLLVSRPAEFQGRIATYDPERSGVGFLFLTQDLELTPRTWNLVRALGRTGAKLYTNTDAMLDRIASGEQLIAYNVLGSYAIDRARHEPSIGVVLPADYTIVVSRIAFIPKAARHPNAARLFLDYLLSREGQEQLAAHSLNPVREDAARSAAVIIPAGIRAVLHPIRVGPELLTYLDQAKRARFLREWRQALDGR